MSVRDRVAKSVFWMVWSRGGLQLISFISTLFVARLLAPADYGLLALAGIWTGIISLIAEMGLGAAIVQFRDLEDPELNGCFWVTMGMAVLGYVGLYVAAPFLAIWFHSPMLSDVLRVLGWTLPLVAIRIVPDSLLRKRLAIHKISQAEIIAAVLTLPLMVGMAVNGAGVWSLVAGAIAAPLIQSIATFWFVRWYPGIQVGGKRLLEVIRYSLATLGTTISWATYQQADTFVLGKMVGEGALGIYSMAQQLAMLPVHKISSVVNQLAFPVMAELQASPEAMRASLLRGVRLVACLAFPLCAGMFLVAEDLVRVLLTEKWLPAVPVLQVLCLYAAIRSIDVLLPPVLMARFRTKFLFGYTLALLAIMPLSFWAGAHWFGAIGVAATWVLVYPIVMSRMADEALGAIQVSWKTLFKQLWPALTATFVMIVICGTVKWSIAWWPNDYAVYRLVILSLVGAAAYTAAMLSFGGTVRNEIQEVVSWMMPVSSKLTPKAQHSDKSMKAIGPA